MPTTLSTTLRHRISLTAVVAESENVLAELLNVRTGLLQLEVRDDPPVSDERSAALLSPIDMLELLPRTGQESIGYRFSIQSGSNHCVVGFTQYDSPSDEAWGDVFIDFPRSVEGNVLTVAVAIAMARRWGHGLQTGRPIMPIQAPDGLEDPLAVLDYLRMSKRPRDLLDAMTWVIDRQPRNWPGLELVIPGAEGMRNTRQTTRDGRLPHGEIIPIDGIRAARPFQDWVERSADLDGAWTDQRLGELDDLMHGIQPGSCWTVPWPGSAAEHGPLNLRVDRNRVDLLDPLWIPVRSALGEGILAIRERDPVVAIDIS